MPPLISVSEALQIIETVAAPVETIQLPLRDAAGHVLAKDMSSLVTLPPNDASAMDGYAIFLESHHELGSEFQLIGEAPAGHPFDGRVGSNEAVRIFTGGAVPDGANHVIIQENVSADGDLVKLTEAPKTSSHIRKAGIDLETGMTILEQGKRLDPFACALLAAANHACVEVYKRPRIALLANGDELVEPGSMINGGEVVSSNPYGLGPLCKMWGADPVYVDILADDPAIIKASIQSCQDADILLPIGGASVGDHDYMRAVFDDLGYQPHFTKVAVKPGKPTWFGKLNHQYVLGLPGNPASAHVCAHIFLKPLIHALINNAAPAHTVTHARATVSISGNGPRADYMRAQASIDETGQMRVTPFPRQDSSLITPFTKTNCLLVRPPNAKAVNEGDIVAILLLYCF